MYCIRRFVFKLQKRTLIVVDFTGPAPFFPALSISTGMESFQHMAKKSLKSLTGRHKSAHQSGLLLWQEEPAFRSYMSITASLNTVILNVIMSCPLSYWRPNLFFASPCAPRRCCNYSGASRRCKSLNTPIKTPTLGLLSISPCGGRQYA